MPVSPRLIRRRIKSVGNTRKITKAMELVAASKMRRAVAAAASSRRYAGAGWEMIVSLAGRIDRSLHPLLTERPIRDLLVILITSHRGLAGGYNTNVLKKALSLIRDAERLSAETPVSLCFIAVGRKGQEAIRRLGKPIVASFATIGDTPSYADATPVAALARQEFAAGTTDRVYLVYTDFVSAILQRPQIRQLLPVSFADAEALLRENAAGAMAGVGEGFPEDLLFEPSRDAVLEAIVPRMVDLQVYQALLESSASEHSSRMIAMRSATDAATEMIDDLTFTFNQARQGAITREISEIAAGKAALEV